MISDHYVEKIEDDAWDAMNLFEDCVVPDKNADELWKLLLSIYNTAVTAQKHSEVCEPR